MPPNKKSNRSDLENYYLSVSAQDAQDSQHPELNLQRTSNEGDVIDADDTTFTTLDQVNSRHYHSFSLVRSSWRKGLLGQTSPVKIASLVVGIIAMKLLYDRLSPRSGGASRVLTRRNTVILLVLVAGIVIVVMKKSKRRPTLHAS